MDRHRDTVRASSPQQQPSGSPVRESGGSSVLDQKQIQGAQKALSAALTQFKHEQQQLFMGNGSATDAAVMRFPFRNRNNSSVMKLERLVEHDLIIAPYFKAPYQLKTEANSGLDATISSHEWPTALVGVQSEKSVCIDNMESFGSLWRLIRPKQKQGKKPTIQNISIANTQTVDETTTFHFQFCVSAVK